MTEGPLHERQRLQMCLKHTLNNLLQGEHTFSAEELNKIAASLEDTGGQHKSLKWWPFQTHHNTLTGNYDVNVLMAALLPLGREAIWLDKRWGLGPVNFDTDTLVSCQDEVVEEKKIVGFVLNVMKSWAGILPGRHWIAVRKIGGVWYNLDSDLKKPFSFGEGSEQVRTFLQDMWDKQGTQLLIVCEGAGTCASGKSPDA